MATHTLKIDLCHMQLNYSKLRERKKRKERHMRAAQNVNIAFVSVRLKEGTGDSTVHRQMALLSKLLLPHQGTLMITAPSGEKRAREKGH